MFPVHVNDGTQPIPEDDVCYIVAKEGVFLKKKMGIMESIAPVQNISILESVQSMARMNIKKIPGGQFARVIAFFREVYKEYYGEAIVLLFYDEERRVYKIVPPHQKVTAAACDYNKGITIEGMQMIGTIHSHASMSAFHSGTDDKDEEHFDGLHITIGNMRDEDVSITASIVANGHRFVVQPEDYVERLVKTVDIDEVENKPTRRVFKWVNGKMVEDTVASTRYSYSYRRMDKRYKVQVSAKYHKVIPAWMEMVEKGTYTYNYGYGGYNQRGVYAGRNANGWGGNYDSDLWAQAGRQIGPPARGAGGRSVFPLAVVKKGETKPHPLSSQCANPIEFPPHDVEIEGGDDQTTIPCLTCVFRGHKLIAEDEFLDDEPDIYKCEKCEAIIVDDTDATEMVTCPTCKTDEHMVVLAEDELPENYVSSEDTSHIKRVPGIKEDSDFLTCPTCGNGFHLFAGETKCPFCYALIGEDTEILGSAGNTEEDRIRQSSADAGQFLDQDTEEINKMALEEARRADQTIERIPDPNESQIPITEVPSGKKDESLMAKFKRVFGGGV